VPRNSYNSRSRTRPTNQPANQQSAEETEEAFLLDLETPVHNTYSIREAGVDIDTVKQQAMAP